MDESNTRYALRMAAKTAKTTTPEHSGAGGAAAKMSKKDHTNLQIGLKKFKSNAEKAAKEAAEAKNEAEAQIDLTTDTSTTTGETPDGSLVVQVPQNEPNDDADTLSTPGKDGANTPTGTDPATAAGSSDSDASSSESEDNSDFDSNQDDDN